jgi:hypothetical protein
MQSVVLKGAEVKTYVSGKLFAEVQSIQYTIDYGEQEIYGIDSQFPQEIASGRVAVQGSVSGLVINGLGGLQAYDLRAKIYVFTIKRSTFRQGFVLVTTNEGGK